MFTKHPDQLSKEEIEKFNQYRKYKLEIGDPLEANPIYQSLLLFQYDVFHPYPKGFLVRGRILLHAQWSAEMRNQWDSIWLFGTITSRTINILFTQSLRCLFIIVHGTPSTYTLRFCASLSWFDRATAPLHLYILGSKFPSNMCDYS